MDAKLKAKVECALHELKTNLGCIERLLERVGKDTNDVPPASGERHTPLKELEHCVDFVLEGLDPDGDSLSDYMDDEVNEG